MSRKRILLLLKPFNVYPTNRTNRTLSRISNPKVLTYLDNRRKVHKDAVRFCENVLRRKSLDWKPLLRSNLLEPIRDIDMVITVGGDGTLLQASHFMDDSIPVLGVNSDPTVTEEVEELSKEFDATRSTGFLCAGTVGNFEQLQYMHREGVKAMQYTSTGHERKAGQMGNACRDTEFNSIGLDNSRNIFFLHPMVLDDVLDGRKVFTELSRISVCVNRQPLAQYALNDLLIAHPCPASVSRFSFKIAESGQSGSSLVNCRSSGLRVSTAAGSTAAILSSGGFPMPITSQDLQYLVREPILQGATSSSLMHGLAKSGESMHLTWYSQEGIVYIDGSHVFHPIQNGDSLEISSQAPRLKVFLPDRSWT